MQRHPIPPISPQFGLRQRLKSGIWAIALVASLAIYQRAVLANPQLVAQKHWNTIATATPEHITEGYSPDAVLLWADNSWGQVYAGSDITRAWKHFLSQHQIQDYEVVEQKWRDRSVQAKLKIKAQSYNGAVAVINISYQAEIDTEGKIIREVWQSNSELNV